MKPRLEQVFPELTIASQIGSQVEKIKLSRQRRRLELLLSDKLDENTLVKLENELKAAINEQNFEKAAELRDRIRSMKEGK